MYTPIQFCLLSVLLVFVHVSAAASVSIAEPALPRIDERTASIVDFGAKGQNVAANTRAFAQAIESLASSGGGRVIVPAGEWVTGPIAFQSGIELHLEAGALIRFSPDRDDYPLIQTSFEGNASWRCQSPISGVGLTDIAITGSGRIDGSGQVWRPVKRSKQTEEQWSALLASGGVLGKNGDIWYPTESAREGNENSGSGRRGSRENALKIKDALRPVMVSLRDCQRILLEGVTFENSPAWSLHPLLCSDLTVRGVTVRNPWYAQNGDGLDVESCDRVLVEDSDFDVGDDAICLKSGRDEEGRRRGRPTSNVLVRRCRVLHGHGGFVVGSEMSGGVRDVRVEDCVFSGTDVGLRFKSRRGRGGVVENISISGIQMTDIVREAIIFNLYYGTSETDIDWNAPAPEADETTPSFRNIEISEVTCEGAGRAALVRGLPEMPVQEVSISRSHFVAKEGIVLSDVDGIALRDVTVEVAEGSPVVTRSVSNADFGGLDQDER